MSGRGVFRTDPPASGPPHLPTIPHPRGKGPRHVLEPEILRPIPAWLEKLAWLMDNSIPLGKRWSVGLDGLIGLIPGAGDLVGVIMSAVIIGAGVRVGLPRAALARMVANAGLDAVVGLVPFLGDLFDFAFKANARNMQIFREAAEGRRDNSRDGAFVAALLLGLAAVIAIPVIGLFLLIRAL